MEDIKHLHSPIVTLNYFSYGLFVAVNNLWAWLTAVATVVGFWKVKTLSPPRSTNEDDTAAEEEFRAKPAVDLKKDNNLSPSIWNCSGGSPKVKFRIRYEEENEFEEIERIKEEEEEEECEGRRAAAREVEGGWWMERRVGDLGWYTCQDRTVLNGSVVRLWGEACRRC